MGLAVLNTIDLSLILEREKREIRRVLILHVLWDNIPPLLVQFTKCEITEVQLTCKGNTCIAPKTLDLLYLFYRQASDPGRRGWLNGYIINLLDHFGQVFLINLEWERLHIMSSSFLRRTGHKHSSPKEIQLRWEFCHSNSIVISNHGNILWRSNR